MLRKAEKIFDNIIDAGALLAALLYIFIMLAVCLGVVSRYVLQSPLLWVVEITAYALLYLTFLGATWLLRKEGHVTMDILVDNLRPRAQAIIGALTSLICAVMFLIIAYYGIIVTWEHYTRGHFDSHSVMQIPDAYPLAVVPIGSILLSIQLLRRAWTHLHNSQEATVDRE